MAHSVARAAQHDLTHPSTSVFEAAFPAERWHSFAFLRSLSRAASLARERRFAPFRRHAKSGRGLFIASALEIAEYDDNAISLRQAVHFLMDQLP